MNIHKKLTSVYWNTCSKTEKIQLLTRPNVNNFQNISVQVQKILDQVRQDGDRALLQFNSHFDHFNTRNLKINFKDIVDSEKKLSNKIKNAIQTAISNITQFHQAQNNKEINIQIASGVYCQQIIRPLNTVGLYVPGGITPLPSTAIMLGIPAKIAQCHQIILCSPPPISDAIKYTAYLCGIKNIYQIGGSQAIAAMGFGTDSIPKVDKIFGPGNVWVTEAKRQINFRPDGTAIDMLAGPSELLIIADNTANPIFIAADLLSQAEHGPDSQVILTTPDIHIANKTQQEINKQLNLLPNKNIKTIKQALIHSCIIITNDIMECFYISNCYAPEHLTIQIYNASNYLQYITNAGSIFLGNWSPESAGDYATGPNHVLPTYGRATNTSGLGVIDFQKRISIQKLDPHGLLKLSSTIRTLANIEQLKAHENAITYRVNHIKGHK